MMSSDIVSTTTNVLLVHEFFSLEKIIVTKYICILDGKIPVGLLHFRCCLPSILLTLKSTHCAIEV